MEKRRKDWAKIGLTDIAHLWKFTIGGICSGLNEINVVIVIIL
jgi:hypothetical protein